MDCKLHPDTDTETETDTDTHTHAFCNEKLLYEKVLDQIEYPQSCQLWGHPPKGLEWIFLTSAEFLLKNSTLFPQSEQPGRRESMKKLRLMDFLHNLYLL